MIEKRWMVVLGLTLLLAAACVERAGIPTLTPTQTPTKLPPTTTPTPTPAGTATLIPTPLPYTGTEKLFFLAPLQGEDFGIRYLWQVNQDGSGLTQLTFEHTWTFAVRPGSSFEKGGEIAYVTGVAYSGKDFLLKKLSLPDMTIRTISPLTNEQTRTSRDCRNCQDFDDAKNPGYAFEALTDRNSLAWSPGGDRLAFPAAINGPYAQIHIYTPATGLVRQVAETEFQARRPSWSPDGRWIVYTVWAGGGGVDTGPHIVDMWAVNSETGQRTSLGEPPVPDVSDDYFSLAEIVYGWSDDTVTLGAFRAGWGANGDIRQVNVRTGDISYIFRAELWSVAYDPEEEVWLVAPAYDGDLMLVKDNEPQRLAIHDPSAVQWMKEYEFFFVAADSGNTFVVSADGTIFPLPIQLETDQLVDGSTYLPAWGDLLVSPNGQYWLWQIDHWYRPDPWSVFEVGQPFYQPTSITDKLVQDALWSPNGESVLFLAEDGLYIAHAPEFKPQLLSSELHYQNYDAWEAVWIP